MRPFLITLLIAFTTVIFSNSTVAQEQYDVKAETIRVRNMHCDGDMPAIKSELLKKDGIMDVSFSDRKMKTALFTIKFVDEVVNRKAIERFIEETPGCDDQSTKPYRVIKEKKKKEKVNEETAK